MAADQRDLVADRRDKAADRRDEAGVRRDEMAEQRDQIAGESDASSVVESLADAVDRSARARKEAASDRSEASRDRRAGAHERTQAELDRDTALADRGASAREREHATVDELTGAYLRGAGMVELEGEIARARRTRQPLVLALVEVDNLKAMNDLRGHAACDRLLIEVASTLRAELRTYDLIIRYADDEFACAISGLNVAGATKRLALVNVVLANAPEHGSITTGLADLQPDDSPDDLVARADAALHRERQRQSTHAVTLVSECGDLVVDEGTRSVTRAGSPVRLTATEFKLLGVLMRNRTRVVPKVQLFGEVWGYDADDHVLDVHMSSLRRKLEAHGPRVIQTVRGAGYVLRP